MIWSEGETATSIPERFDRQARLAPGAIAIDGGSEALTFEELDQLADGYAHALPERAGPARAALLLDHGTPVIAGALGALRAGYAVIALATREPPQRLAELRASVEPAVLLTGEPYLASAHEAGFSDSEIVVLDGAAAGPRGAQPAEIAPDDLAFLISTSGSAGRPKVVMHSHRTILHNVLRYTNGLGIRPDDRIVWLASLSGGQGLATAWTALLNGATLCPWPIADRGVTGLAEWMVERRVTVFDTLPSVLRNFARTLGTRQVTGVRLVRLASEAGLRSDYDAFRRHFPPPCVVGSVLGSSETGIMAQTIFAGDYEPADDRLTVGGEAEGVRLLLLDEAGQGTRDGDVGEIVAAGPYLSPGYWRDDALTAQRFEAVDGERRFRTGDLARRSPRGELTIMGRADSQVKVRGHRLQLEEVESALAAQPEVGAAAVAVRFTQRGDATLTAYLTPAQDRVLDTRRLRRSLQIVLPPHAVPTALVPVDALPLTPHGKIDRERLQELELPGARAGSAGRELSETEELLIGLWCQAFEREDIGPDDAFLDLGGDSLAAAVLAALVQQACGVELDLGVFASEITVASMATLVEIRARDMAGGEELPPLRPRQPPPASLSQLSMWGVAKRNPEHLTLASAYRISGPLDVEALRLSIAQVIRRHAILSTGFHEAPDGQLFQLLHPPAPDLIAFDDLRSEADPELRAKSILVADAECPFDLGNGPLLRFRLVRLADQEYQLLRVSNHLITDMMSWRFFFDELAVLYEARLEGKPSALDRLPELQYADYATWERSCLAEPHSAQYDADIAWWQRTLESPPPPLRLPFERAVALDTGSPPQTMVDWGLPVEHSVTLDRIGRERGATFFMTRLASFAALLALDSGSDDLLVEIFTSLRRRVELQTMIGLFINRTWLRLRFPAQARFVDWLDVVRDAVIDCSAHSRIPDRRVVSELHRRGVSIPPVAVKFGESHQLLPMRFGGLVVEALPREPSPQPRFTLNVDRHYEADRCRAELDPRVHDPAGVAGFIRRLQALIAAVCADPRAPLPDVHGSLPR